MLDKETAKAIQALNLKIYKLQKQIEAFYMDRHKENAIKIETDESGILEIADSVSAHDDAILELAEIISSLDGGSNNG